MSGSVLRCWGRFCNCLLFVDLPLSTLLPRSSHHIRPDPEPLYEPRYMWRTK